MNTTECSEAIFLKAICAISFFTVLLLYFRKSFTKLSFRTDLPEHEVSAILKFRTEFTTQLKELAQKTTEEGCLLSDGLLTSADQSSLRLRERCAAMQELLIASLEREHAKTGERFEELERSVEAFGKESLFLRDSLSRATEDQERLFCENEANRRVVETTTQTATDYDAEAFDNEDIKSILLAIKDSMDQIVSESKFNRENFVQEISSFVKKHYKNIKQLAYFMITDNLEKLRQLQIDILMVETEGIEKQLLDVFIFLDRKLVDVQAIEETLKFFNRKFTHFADKCESKWNDSCSKFDTTRELVCEAKDNLIFSSSKMSRMSCSLSQQTTDLDQLAKRLGDYVQKTAAIFEAEALRKSSRDRVEEIAASVDHMRDTLAKIGKEYSRRMEDVSEMLESPGRRLESFLQYVEDMEVLNDLVKNIAATYEDMMTSVSVREQGDSCPPGDDCPEFDKEAETSSTVSVDELSSYQAGDGLTEFSFDCNHSKSEASDLLKKGGNLETRKHSTLRRMIAVLGDVIKKAAVELVEKDGGKLKGKFSPANAIEDKLETEDFAWSSVPSEVSLSEVTDDCLIPNSGSSSSSGEEQCKL